jgi:hypothetical protein
VTLKVVHPDGVVDVVDVVGVVDLIYQDPSPSGGLRSTNKTLGRSSPSTV